MSVSTESAHILAAHRNYPTRATSAQQDILARGRAYLADPRALQNLGNEGWALLEQVALAALNLGQLDVADECLTRLSDKFPASPRVDRLRGLALEAVGDEAQAQALYDALIESDPTNIPVRKRRIALARARGDIREALDELLLLVDTWYADAEAWLELADVYASCALYPQSLSALSHTLLLNPQNPFHVLRAAETAYTAQDIPLALKFFLRTVEMMDEAAGESDGGAGALTRAWYGVKLCARRLLTPASSSSPPVPPSASGTPSPSALHLGLLDELATERILAAYSSPAVRSKKAKGDAVPADVRGVVLKWLQGK